VQVKLTLSDPEGGTWSALGERSLPGDEPLAMGSIAYSLELAPYDICALRGSSGRAQVSSWQTTLSPTAAEDLRRHIDALRAKVIALRQIKPLATLANADFEKPATPEQQVPNWIHADAAGLSFALDRADARGKQALHFTSRGPVGWLRSDPIPVPRTGRLSVNVWLKTKNAEAQPPLRLAIEGQYRGQSYYRFATVGAGTNAPQLRDHWGTTPYLFHIDDLPTSDLTDLRIGFDLMGPGEVWIDDVQVFELYFRENERDEIMKMIALADLHLGKGQIAQCERLLEGYWPRYLMTHVSDELVAQLAENPTPERASPTTPSNPPVESPPPATSFRDRMWNWVPKWR
jgi:hypothetical protein